MFLREYSSNMYGTLAYFCSKMMVEVPLGAVQALLALSISHRCMRFQGEFLEMWATVCLLNACAVAFSLLIGCLVRFPRESGAIGPLVFVPQLLMSGTFIPVQAIPQFLRWMQYISFLQPPSRKEKAPASGAEVCREAAGHCGVPQERLRWRWHALAFRLRFSGLRARICHLEPYCKPFGSSFSYLEG